MNRSGETPKHGFDVSRTGATAISRSIDRRPIETRRLPYVHGELVLVVEGDAVAEVVAVVVLVVGDAFVVAVDSGFGATAGGSCHRVLSRRSCRRIRAASCSCSRSCSCCVPTAEARAHLDLRRPSRRSSCHSKGSLIAPACRTGTCPRRDRSYATVRTPRDCDTGLQDTPPGRCSDRDPEERVRRRGRASCAQHPGQAPATRRRPRGRRPRKRALPPSPPRAPLRAEFGPALWRCHGCGPRYGPQGRAAAAQHRTHGGARSHPRVRQREGGRLRPCCVIDREGPGDTANQSEIRESSRDDNRRRFQPRAERATSSPPLPEPSVTGAPVSVTSCNNCSTTPK